MSNNSYYTALLGGLGGLGIGAGTGDAGIALSSLGGALGGGLGNEAAKGIATVIQQRGGDFLKGNSGYIRFGIPVLSALLGATGGRMLGKRLDGSKREKKASFIRPTIQAIGLFDAMEKQAGQHNFQFPQNIQERGTGQGTRNPAKWDPNDRSIQQQLNARMDDAESLYNNRIQQTRTSKEDVQDNVYKLNQHFLKEYGASAPKIINYGNYDPKKDNSQTFPSQNRAVARYLYPEQYRANKYDDPDAAHYSPIKNQVILGANHAAHPGVLYHEAGHFIDDENRRIQNGLAGVQQHTYDYAANPEKKLAIEQAASDNGSALYKKLSPDVSNEQAYNGTHAGLVTYYPKANAYSFSKGYRRSHDRNLMFDKPTYDDRVQQEYVKNRYDKPTQASDFIDKWRTQA